MPDDDPRPPGPANDQDGDFVDGEQGGDPACWLRQVCPACGRFVETAPPTTCPRCDTELSED